MFKIEAKNVEGRVIETSPRRCLWHRAQHPLPCTASWWWLHRPASLGARTLLKNRSLVVCAKLFRQGRGTGCARQGTIQPLQFRGGGVTSGLPHSHALRTTSSRRS